ncbi:MAG: glycosyl hydrolase 53 family protein [Prevotella sp.]
MKKFQIRLLLGVWMLCALTLVSCGGSDDSPAETTSPPAAGGDNGNGGGNSGGDEGNTEEPQTPETPGEDLPADFKSVGGDISLLPQYERHGAIYMDENGVRLGNMLTYFSDNGWNTMRVRLFHNPANASDKDKDDGVCQDLAYVTALGQRIKQAGLRFCLDFHYSDSWADPNKQYTPAAWAEMGDAQLQDAVYTYTQGVLEHLNAAGATPDFIQTGNEISYGMLWGKEGSSDLKKCFMGSSANWDRFISLLKNAGRACREVCPKAKIILHTERTGQWNVLDNFYKKMKDGGVDYDIIGLSYYPIWHNNLLTLESTLQNLEKNYPDKKIAIVEVGYYYAWYPSDADYDYTSTYPATPAGQQSFIADLVTKLNSHASVMALWYWWPEANEYGLDWNTNRVTNGWNNTSLFDNSTGKVHPALKELRNFR